MFERYTDNARRALFYGRAVVSEHGGTSIGATHLLVGLLRALPDAAAVGLGGAGSVQALSECLVTMIASETLLSESAEIPFDWPTKRILQRCGWRPIVTGVPHGQDIDVEDVLLALLREGPEDPLTCLRRVGLDVVALEQRLAAERGW